MFHVKQGDVPRSRETGERRPSDTAPAAAAAKTVDRGPAQATKTKRAPVTFEEVATAAEKVLQAGERVTIERVRKEVGGGGNQAVMGHLDRWRHLRRKGAQFGGGLPGGLMSEGLKAALSQAIDDEIREQLQAAEAAMREQHEELVEACGALEADLKVTTSAAFEQEEDLEKMAAALAQAQHDLEAQRHQGALAREGLLGEVRTLTRQHEEMRASVEAGKEAAIAARFKDAAQVSQIAALQAEVKTLRESLDGAKAKITQAEQKAAVAQTQVTGKDELLKILQGQLHVSQTRARELTEEARRSHERAQAAEQTQEKLRHKLDVHHPQERDHAKAPDHERSTKMGFGAAKTQQDRAPGADASAPARRPSPALQSHRGVEPADEVRRTPTVAPQERAAPATAYERERMIETFTGPSRPSLMRHLGKPDTKDERERAKELATRAAALRGIHLQRGNAPLPHSTYSADLAAPDVLETDHE